MKHYLLVLGPIAALAAFPFILRYGGPSLGAFLGFLFFTLRYFAWFLLGPAILWCRTPEFRVLGLSMATLSLLVIGYGFVQDVQPKTEVQIEAIQNANEARLGDMTQEEIEKGKSR